MVRVLLRGRYLAFLLAAAAMGALAWHFLPRETPTERRGGAARFMNDLMAGNGPIGAPFTLTDHAGKSVRLSDFRGHAVLLYFGYTYCPDVCPTDLLAIGQAIERLGAAGGDLQPIFVTLDPARDTRQVIGAYAKSFHPRFVALTGSEEEIGRVARSYKVYFEKFTPPHASTYLIDHMALTFLLDREGRYVGFLPPGTSAERMADLVLETLMKPVLQQR